MPSAAAVVAISAFFALRGKNGGEVAVSSEAAMEEHYADLKKIRATRVPIANERAKAVQAMEAIIAEARNALAAGGVENPSDDALKAEIEGHPERYPEWKGLYEKVVRLNEEYDAKQREMQAAVRAYMVRTGVKVPGVPQRKQGK